MDMLYCGEGHIQMSFGVLEPLYAYYYLTNLSVLRLK